MEVSNLLGENGPSTGFACSCPPGLVHACLSRQRVLDPPRVDYRHLAGYRHSLAMFYRQLKKWKAFRVTSMEDVVNSYSGKKKRHYQRCMDVFEEFGLKSLDSIKHVAFSKWGERNARPRAIIPQVIIHDGEPLFLPILIERMYRMRMEKKLEKIRNMDGSRMFAAGRNLRQRASDITSMFRRGCRVISIDVSSFDGSEGDLAECERRSFLKEFRGAPALRRVIRDQSKMRVRTRDISMTIGPNRASGTGGTSIGNKLVMMSALYYACGLSASTGDVRFYCDGDDTLLFVDSTVPDATVTSWMRRLSFLGLDVKVDNIAYRLEDVLFCRSRLVSAGGSLTLAKIPEDAWKTVCNVVRHIGPELPTYLSTLRMGFSNMWNGIPVLRSMHKVYPRGKVKSELLSSSGLEYMFWDLNGYQDEILPTYEDRVWFETATGISLEAQIAFEDALENARVAWLS